MAFTQALSRSLPAPTKSAEELVTILAAPLPALPSGDTADAAAELRRMHSSCAVEVWRHPGWAQLVDWIVRRVPDCDPTTAAVHAVRNRERAVSDPDYARSLAGYVRQIAHRSAEEGRKAQRVQELTWDPPQPPVERLRPTESLVAETASLLSVAGVRPSEESWNLINAGVDTAVDWWDGLAARTGLVGDELVRAARRSRQTTGNQRLRANFDGPTARPLVALLVGGDQRGRSARQAAGVEAGLLYWSMLVRRADTQGGAAPIPPAPIRRAWATHVDSIERAISSTDSAATPATGPTIAA